MSFVLPLGVTPTVPDTWAPLIKHELVGLSTKLLPLTVAVVVVALLVLLLVLFCESTTVKDKELPVVAVKLAFQVPLTLALVPVLDPHALSMIANPTTNAVKNRRIIPNLFNFYPVS